MEYIMQMCIGDANFQGIAINIILFPFDCLTFTFGHFLGEGLLAVLADVADTSRAIGLEQECEYLTDEIGICLALGHVLMTFGTGVVTLTSDARPYLAPRCLVILMATGAFVRQILTARTAVESARGNEFFVSFDSFHFCDYRVIRVNSSSIHSVASMPTKRSST